MADRKGIELARVGEFDLAIGGKQQFTPEMLTDAARRAGAAGPSFRAPVKLGHTDPRNDGEPAMGWLHNLRVEGEGDQAVLLGDVAGMPQWLADNPDAYPDRSIEGNLMQAADGSQGLEVSGLALLGVTPPAMGSLTSWRTLPGLIAASAAVPLTAFAAAYEAVRDLPQTPAAEPVVTPPNPKEADTMSDTLNQGLRERLGVAAETDEAGLLSALDEALGERATPAVTPEAIAAAFKLTPEQVTTALAAAAKPPAATDVPAGTVAISKDVLDELKLAASAGAEARKVQLKQERETVIGGHIAASHILPARKDFWTTKWNLDPEGTKAELATLGEPVLPIAASGTPGGDLDGGNASFTDDEASGLALLTGFNKEAFLA